MYTDIIFLVISLLFVFFGIIVHYGKCYNLIAGYNTMSIAQKRKITKEQLTGVSRGMKNLFCGLGFLWLVGLFVFHYFKIYQYFVYFILITMTIWCILFIVIIFRINRKK
ncbi:MAG: DUF3784 domain-containing protein [Bacteroidales bacterium]|nr:DUF3784 domain-containing protein [Bacteroidales bacterium]